MRDDYDLWQGGPWERPPGDVSLPEGLWAPVPARPVLRVKRRRRRWRIPAVLLCLILGTSLLSVALHAALNGRDTDRPSWDGGPGGDRDSYYQEEDYSTAPPSIPRAVTGTGVTLELLPAADSPLGYNQIYAKNLPSMVSIRAEEERAYSTGTGIVLTKDGYVVTNAHVVAGAREVKVTFSSNLTLEARLVGFDAEEDLAVLKVEAENLTPAEFGDSFALRCGDPVAAIGDPLGYRATITDGIVSALDREVKVDGVTMTLIQTSAPINFGNSGGALINQYGQVVGITTVKIIANDGSTEGLGFAIPSRRVKYVADALIDGQEVRAGAFGFTVYTVPVDGGLRLLEVDPRSGAWASGLRAGDVVTAVNGQPVSAKEDLARAKQIRGAGDVLELTYVREGETFTVEVTLVDEDSLDK